MRMKTMSETNNLTELKELMDKIKNRSKRIQESTQNPSQASLDALYSDIVDAYWLVNELAIKQEQPPNPQS